jgi:hypothetical protein
MRAAIATAQQHQASLSTRNGYLLSSANVSHRRLLRLPREVLEAAFCVVIVQYYLPRWAGDSHVRSVFYQGLLVSVGYHSLQRIASPPSLNVRELITEGLAILNNYQFLSSMR